MVQNAFDVVVYAINSVYSLFSSLALVFDLVPILVGLFFAFIFFRYILHPLTSSGFSSSIIKPFAGLFSGSSDKAKKKE